MDSAETLECPAQRGAAYRRVERPRDLNRAAGKDPLDSLSRNRRDPIEVLVVVENYQAGALGNGGDEEVGESRRAVLFPLGKRCHHVCRSVEIVLLHCNRPQRMRDLLADSGEVCTAPRTEEYLERDNAAGRHVPSLDEWR